MTCIIDWKAQHALDLTPGSYFSSVLLTAAGIDESTAGRDTFMLNGLILPGKRLSGLGREAKYNLSDFPAGLTALEAKPSLPIATDTKSTLRFAVDTNILISQDQLSNYLSLEISTDDQVQTIPLQAANVAIDWQARGKYIINITL